MLQIEYYNQTEGKCEIRFASNPEKIYIYDLSEFYYRKLRKYLDKRNYKAAIKLLGIIK